MYFKLLVFKMGKMIGDCYNCWNIDFKCQYKTGFHKCSFRICPECVQFIWERQVAVRVFFQPTRKIAKLGTFIVRNNINPSNIVSIVTYHLDCYKKQHNRWLDTQASKAEVIDGH